MSKMSVSSAGAFVGDIVKRLDTHLFSTYCDSRVSTESGLLVSEVFDVSVVVLHMGLHVVPTDTSSSVRLFLTFKFSWEN